MLDPAPLYRVVFARSVIGGYWDTKRMLSLIEWSSFDQNRNFYAVSTQYPSLLEGITMSILYLYVYCIKYKHQYNPLSHKIYFTYKRIEENKNRHCCIICLTRLYTTGKLSNFSKKKSIDKSIINVYTRLLRQEWYVMLIYIYYIYMRNPHSYSISIYAILEKKFRLPYEEWSIDEILTTDWTTIQQFPFVILIVGTIFFKKKTKEKHFYFFKNPNIRKRRRADDAAYPLESIKPFSFKIF